VNAHKGVLCPLKNLKNELAMSLFCLLMSLFLSFKDRLLMPFQAFFSNYAFLRTLPDFPRTSCADLPGKKKTSPSTRRGRKMSV